LETKVNGFRERLNQIWGHDPNDSSQALQWIRSCVANQVPEDLYLEFKRESPENTPIPDDADTGQLARAISGFANTDGGLLVWGVEAKARSKEDPDVAQSLRPIRGVKVFTTRLNAVCGGAVNPPLPGIENRMVSEDAEADVGFTVTLVPPRRATHTQAAMGKKYSGQYFIRTGSGFCAVPEPLLAEFYGRRPRPILRFVLELACPEETSYEPWARRPVEFKRIMMGIEPPSPEAFGQALCVPWRGDLINDGLGSANGVVLEVHVTGSDALSVLGQEVQFAYDDMNRQVPLPWPKSCLQPLTYHKRRSSSSRPFIQDNESRLRVG